MKSPLFRIVLFSSGLACALVAPGYVLTSSAQETSKPLVAWAKEHAIPITTVEPGHGFADLQALKTTIGHARIVALGESAHQWRTATDAIHEFRAFRNRLLEFLVREMGFTAIAVETGFFEGVEVDDYVTGRTAGSANLAMRVFCWSPQRDTENLELIEWMRRYNAQPSTTRKIRFYGIDLTGGRDDVGFTESGPALDAALSYIERVDAGAGKEFRARLEPFLPKFTVQAGAGLNEGGYYTLAPTERNTLTATIADLVNLFDRRRIDFLAVTPERDYQIAYRHAISARQLDALFR